MRRTLILIVITGAVFVLTACGSSSIGITVASESFTFRGASLNTAGLELEPQIDSALKEALDSRMFASGLYRGLTSDKSNLKIQDSNIHPLFVRERLGNYEGADDEYVLNWGIHSGMYTDYRTDRRMPAGTLRIEGKTARVELVMDTPGDEFSQLSLSGSFDRDEAQAAINEIRKTTDYGNSDTSFRSFNVDWQISGSFNGEPFSTELTQLFHAHKILTVAY